LSRRFINSSLKIKKSGSRLYVGKKIKKTKDKGGKMEKKGGCKGKCENCKDKDFLPDSGKKFPDGAHYRIEVSGIETAGSLGAVVEEAKKQKIPIHRAIATVKGSAFYSDEQLAALAHLAAKEKIEVIICPWKSEPNF
jgi:hypothetical protein